MKLRLTALALFAALTLAACGRTERNTELTELDPFVEQTLETFDMPGMAIAVVHRDQVIYADGVGVKELGQPDQIDGETLFQIGSTSKAFAAAAIAAAVDEGKLNWDDTVQSHLPWFKTPDAEITTETTIRELLSHTSGIGGDIGTAVIEMSPQTGAERLRLPGTTQATRGSFLYSNAGMALTELLVGAVEKDTWHDHVRRKLFEPLRMADSATSPYEIWERQFVAPVFLGSAPNGSASIKDAPSFNVAMPHGRDSNGNRKQLPWQSYDAMAPAGSIVSNAKDMAQWLRLWLGKGTVDGNQVLSAASVEEITSVQVEDKDPYFLYSAKGSTDSHGFGWTIGDFEGHKVVYHGGGIFGFPAFVAFFPDHDLGIAVLANGSHPSPYYPHQAIVGWVANQYLAVDDRDWIAEAASASEEYSKPRLEAADKLASERDLATSHSLELENYAGIYESVDEDKQLGRAEITFANGRLHFGFTKPGELSGEFEHWGSERFRLNYAGGDGVVWSHLVSEFEVTQGKVEAINIDLLGRFRKVD